MAKEIYLNGMTADQLSEMIRESLRGKICAHKIGGRVLFRDSDVEAALNRIVPIK